MSGRVIALFAAIALTLLGGRAHAQSCHADAVRGAGEDGVRLRSSLALGWYDFDGVKGNYQGLGVAAGLRASRFDANLAWTYYRLNANDEERWGGGDLIALIRGLVLSPEDDGMLLSVGAHAMFPTEAMSLGTSMGHVMLGPEVLASRTFGDFVLSASVTYLRRVGASNAEHSGHAGHMHHGSAPPVSGQWPLVDPHNASELGGSVGLSYVGHDVLRPRLVVYGAAPVANDGSGAARVIYAPGLSVIVGDVTLTIDAELPAIGNAIEARLITGAAVALH